MRAKRMIVGVLAAILLVGATGCAPMKILDIVKGQTQPEQEAVDFDGLIDSFVPDTYNVFVLEAGEIHKPDAAVWIKKGDGQVYSSDEDVVTITKYGKVTAEGTGTAYVVIVGSAGANEVYQYTVVEDEGLIEEKENNGITTDESKLQAPSMSDIQRPQEETKEEPPKESEDIDFGRVF